MLGFRECEACCVPVDVGGGSIVDVVVPAGLVLLKAKAYLDRRPAMTHDVQDIDFIARTYRDALGDSAVFERAAAVLQDERVSYEHVGAYLLGRDIAARGFGDAAMTAPRALLAELMDPMSRAVDDVRASSGWGLDQDRRTIVLRYVALRLGLGP